MAVIVDPEIVFDPAKAPYRVVATTVPMTLIVDAALERVRVFANTLVVVTALAE